MKWSTLQLQDTAEALNHTAHKIISKDTIWPVLNLTRIWQHVKMALLRWTYKYRISYRKYTKQKEVNPKIKWKGKKKNVDVDFNEVEISSWKHYSFIMFFSIFWIEKKISEFLPVFFPFSVTIQYLDSYVFGSS